MYCLLPCPPPTTKTNQSNKQKQTLMWQKFRTILAMSEQICLFPAVTSILSLLMLSYFLPPISLSICYRNIIIDWLMVVQMFVISTRIFGSITSYPMVVFHSKTPRSVLPPKGTYSSEFYSPISLSHFSPGASTASHIGHPHASAFKIIK